MKLKLAFTVCALALLCSGTAALAASPSATLSYHGLGADLVGQGYTADADGKPDGHFTLVLDTGGTAQVVTNIELSSGTGGVWDTLPQGSWAVLGIVRNGQRLNPKDEGIHDSATGKVTYELYAADYGMFGSSGQGFSVTVSFADGSKTTSGRAGAAATASSNPPATTTATPSATKSREPNTRQAIPDFWAALSASVITKNTLGLGRDGALTSGAVNNQVLTVTVLERATGCLIQGATVELRDPQGNPVPGARFQTRAGIIDMGGLRLQKPGTYHLWVHADDASGGVVMQSWLPVPVIDRKGQSFQTLNGRTFTYAGGGQWTETNRSVASAGRTAFDPIGAIVSAFQQLISGITQSHTSSAQKAKATQAAKILADPKASPAAKLQKVQSQTSLVPEYLVTSAGQGAEARVADISAAKPKLITNDGGSLITNDGGSLITNDGGSLITNDGGSIMVRGGNIVSTSGAGVRVNGRFMQAAGVPAPPCLSGFKTVGPGKVVVVDGSPVLAEPNGKLEPGTLVIGGRNAMPVNGLAK